jgi:cytosine/adenosine deaminase-related metal-dependent hydrolase
MINYNARWVIPVATEPLRDATVTVADRHIVYVGPRDRRPSGSDVDLGDAVLLPGLVNAHTHLELTAMRGLLRGIPFVPWIRALTEARAAVLTEATMLDAARWGIVEGLLAGITTYADTSASGVVLRALNEMRVRGIMYQEVFGPSPAQRTAALDDLRARVDALREWETPLARLGVSPHAPYTVHEDLLIDVTAYAVGAGLPVAMHLAESDAEIRFLREGEGPFAEGLRARGIPVMRRSHSPVHLLVELGVVLARPLLIHCVQIDETDIAFIAEHACPVAHCPTSNAELGHGIAPLREMLDAGVTVGVGSDSLASNDRLDMLSEARLAMLLQCARLKRPDALTRADAVSLATIRGARALGLDDRIGTLEPGKEADLAAFSLAGARPTASDDPWEATLTASATPAILVVVAGRELVRNGQVYDVETPELRARVAESARALGRHVGRNGGRRWSG